MEIYIVSFFLVFTVCAVFMLAAPVFGLISYQIFGNFWVIPTFSLLGVAFFFYTLWKSAKNPRSNVIEIRPGFGASGLFPSFVSLIATFCVVVLIGSGLVVFPTPFFRFFEIGINDWLARELIAKGFNLLQGPDWMQLRFFLVCVGAAAFAFPFAFTMGLMGPKAMDRITLRPDSISFPSRFAFNLRFHLSQKWTNLLAFEIKSDLSGKQKIRFLFQDGAVSINREHVSENSLKTLLSYVSRFAPSALGLSIHDNLVAEALQDSQVYDVDLIDKGQTLAAPEEISYTEIWESDFRRQSTSTTFVPLKVGDKLQSARYQIVSRIANTAMSATYLARTEDNENVVVKETVVPLDSDAAQRAKENYFRECRYLSQVNHPSIAKVHDSFVENQRCYLIIEYIAGKDLNLLVQESGALSEKKVLKIALQIVDTLIYLHGLQPPLIHRDLTPDNIVIDRKNRAFVVDFGAANSFQANVTGTMIGKQSYIAPEQLRGKATPQSDLYALGATMYKLLTSKDPEALSECDVRSVDASISGAMTKLIRDCTKFDEVERIQSALELKQRLQEIHDEKEYVFKLKLQSPEESEVLKVPGAKELVIEND
ncbi:MAG: serine/threonine protein kinase [Candidatus Obscuribacterales bacterium]|nr:serine/threonine protein kinase [Candidatus Obscuribacterales bacterium]